jgi:hypothetical protein
MRRGLTVRDRLDTELCHFACPYQVVLTVDRELFPDGPESAYRWVQETHAISEFVKGLRRLGWLAEGRYFSVLEFQMKKDRAGWPHWHVVFDTSFIPFFDLAEAWAKAGWGGSAGKARWGERPVTRIDKNSRPVFGRVWFVMKGERKGLVRYLTQYLVKQPKEGLPEWALDTRLQLRRWSTSRGFWRIAAALDQKPVPESDFASLRERYVDDDDEWGDAGGMLEKVLKIRSRPTLRHRLSECGKKSVVLVQTATDLPDGWFRWRWRYVGNVPSPVWSSPEEQKGCRGTPLWERPVDVKRSSFCVSSPADVAFLSSLVREDSLGRGLVVVKGETFGNHWKE